MRIEGLSFSYDKSQVFKDFSLSPKSGIVTLTGPPGCGKTTLLKLLTGNLIPNHFQLFEVESDSLLILQEDALLPWLSGVDNIRVFTGLTNSHLHTHALYPLISGFVHRKSFEMSFGQRRMIELFRALVLKPQLLCLDEPFNFLDQESKVAILRYISTEASKHSRIVFASHYPEELSPLHPEVFVFSGRLPVANLMKAGEPEHAS